MGRSAERRTERQQPYAGAEEFREDLFGLGVGGKRAKGDALIFVLTRVLVDELKKMGYDIGMEERTSGPINAIYFDREHGTSWGGSGDHDEGYGIAW